MCQTVRYARPSNPCPDIVDLDLDVEQRGYFDPTDEAERNTCNIEWRKRYEDLDIWR